MKSIIETAKEAGSFKTLLIAAEKAGLVKTLEGKGPYTVFAPSDNAFSQIPEKDLKALLKDKKKLSEILLYHVVPGNVSSRDVGSLKKAKTVQGQDIRIDTSKGVRINDSQVTQADIKCSNGMIHVIDKVMMPK